MVATGQVATNASYLRNSVNLRPHSSPHIPVLFSGQWVCTCPPKVPFLDLAPHLIHVFWAQLSFLPVASPGSAVVARLTVMTNTQTDRP